MNRAVNIADASVNTLDYLVAQITKPCRVRFGPNVVSHDPFLDGRRKLYRPSQAWEDGGPIIERHEIGIKRNAPCSAGRQWEASPSITRAGGKWGYGTTPLIAAMRAFLISKLGERAEVPEEFL